MGRKPTGMPNGRPPKEIDFQLFEQLCGLQCTHTEIASMLKVCVDTMYDKVKAHYGDSFSNVYKKYSESGKCSLRRNQFALSKTNASMAIWLGKIYLGQQDPEKFTLHEAKDIFLGASEIVKDSTAPRS